MGAMRRPPLQVQTCCPAASERAQQRITDIWQQCIRDINAVVADTLADAAQWASQQRAAALTAAKASFHLLADTEQGPNPPGCLRDCVQLCRGWFDQELVKRTSCAYERAKSRSSGDGSSQEDVQMQQASPAPPVPAPASQLQQQQPEAVQPPHHQVQQGQRHEQVPQRPRRQSQRTPEQPHQRQGQGQQRQRHQHQQQGPPSPPQRPKSPPPQQRRNQQHRAQQQHHRQQQRWRPHAPPPPPPRPPLQRSWPAPGAWGWGMRPPPMQQAIIPYNPYHPAPYPMPMQPYPGQHF